MTKHPFFYHYQRALRLKQRARAALLTAVESEYIALLAFHVAKGLQSATAAAAAATSEVTEKQLQHLSTRRRFSTWSYNTTVRNIRTNKYPRQEYDTNACSTKSKALSYAPTGTPRHVARTQHLPSETCPTSEAHGVLRARHINTTPTTASRTFLSRCSLHALPLHWTRDRNLPVHTSIPV